MMDILKISLLEGVVVEKLKDFSNPKRGAYYKVRIEGGISHVLGDVDFVDISLLTPGTKVVITALAEYRRIVWAEESK
jgi:hypothetical protein